MQFKGVFSHTIRFFVLCALLTACNKKLSIRGVELESGSSAQSSPDPWTHGSIAWNDAYNFSVSNMSPVIMKAKQASDGGFLLSGYFNAIGRESVAVGTMKLNPATAVIDSTYNTAAGTGFQGTYSTAPVYYGGVYDIEEDPTDTSVHYYSGVFTTYNGVTANKVARINNDGSLDTSFNPGVFKYLGGTQAYVSAVLPLGNALPAYAGKVLVFGIFDEIGGVATPVGVALLDHDGTLNTADFNPGSGFVDSTASGLYITEAKQHSDGTIYAAGRFTHFNGFSSTSIVQFLVQSNGLVMVGWMGGYQGFDTLLPNPPFIYDFEMSSSGTIYVVGSMTDYNGSSIGRVAALNSDGSEIAGFTANVSTGFDNEVFAISLNDAETKIAVAGAFSWFEGVNYVPSLAVLNTNGTIDAGFSPGSGPTFAGSPTYVAEVEYDDSGNIFVAGAFETWNANYAMNLIKLDSTGAIVSAFDTGGSVNAIGKTAGPATFYTTRGNSYINGNSIFKMNYSNGELLVGGYFSYYGGVLANGYAKLDSEGVPVPKSSFNALSIPESLGTSIVELTDGSGDFYHLTTDGSSYYIYRMNSDGSLHAGYPAPIVLNDNTGGVLAIDSSSNLYVGGNFTTVSGVPVPQGFSKVSPAGVVDVAFNAALGTGFDTNVSSIEVTSDTVYLGGAFSNLNGAPMPGGLQYFYAVSSTNGTISPRIASVGTGPDAQVYTIKKTSDGVYIGGNFNNFNGSSAIYLAKLSNTNGSLITAFDTANNYGNSYVSGIDIGTNGEILVSGAFNSYTGSTSVMGVVLDPVTAVADPGFSMDVTGSAVRMGMGFIPVNDGYIFYGLYTTLNGSQRVRGFGRVALDGTTYTP